MKAERFLPLLLLLLVPTASHGQALWVIDTLDASVRVSQLSLAIDSTDRLHASYRDASTGRLNYGTWESGVWTTETVVDSGGSSSLAVTPAGDPSIAYTAWNLLRFTRKTAEGWITEIGDAPGSVVGSPSLGLRSDGRPDIAYLGGVFEWESYCRYATKRTAGWTSEPISSGTVEEEGDLAIGSDDRPRIAFAEKFSGEENKLVVAMLEQDEWNTETVDSGGYGFGWNRGVRLAVDAAGRPQTAYLHIDGDYESSNYTIRFASRSASGAWNKTDIEWVPNDWWMNLNNWMVMHDLALGPDGSPRVLYFKGIDSTGVHAESLLVARRVDGSWIKECVRPGAVRDAALALDSEGTPFVLFRLPPPAPGLFLARRVDATGTSSAPRPASAVKLSVRPNPMHGAVATISFAIPGTEGGALAIYDIRGRVVRSFDAYAPSGALDFDGADASGRPLAPGVYFVRLESADGRAATVRLAIVR
jgi:hypothetical protein